MAMVEWFDITVGQLGDFLEQKNLAENTLVIYVCDNGWITNPEKNGNPPYSPKSKQTPYEMGIRTPIILKWQGKIESEVDTTSFVSSIDILPTILDVLDFTHLSNLSGISLMDRAAIRARPIIFSEDFSHDMMDPDLAAKSLEHLVVLKNPWKLIIPYNAMVENGSIELYNIFEDPHETINKAHEFPEIVDDLRKDLKEFWIPTNVDQLD
jgi:uncharacterized sulfatase